MFWANFNGYQCSLRCFRGLVKTSTIVCKLQITPLASTQWRFNKSKLICIENTGNYPMPLADVVMLNYLSVKLVYFFLFFSKQRLRTYVVGVFVVFVVIFASVKRGLQMGQACSVVERWTSTDTAISVHSGDALGQDVLHGRNSNRDSDLRVI